MATRVLYVRVHGRHSYKCPICGSYYDENKKAAKSCLKACLDFRDESSFKVGDKFKVIKGVAARLFGAGCFLKIHRIAVFKSGMRTNESRMRVYWLNVTSDVSNSQSLVSTSEALFETYVREVQIERIEKDA